MATCGIAAENRYRKRDYRPGGPDAARGIAAHEAVRHVLREKMEGRVVLPETAAQEADAAFSMQVKRGVRFTRDEEKQGVAKILDSHRDFARRAAAFYAFAVAPSIEPAFVERKYELRPSAAIPVPFVGVIDVIERDGTLRDTKTTRRTPDEDIASKSWQLGTYNLLRRAYGEPDPPRMVLDYLVDRPITKQRKVATVEHVERATEPWMPLDLDRMVQRHRKAIEAFAAGAFVPASEGSWKCSEKWCEYWTDCPFAQGKR